HRERRIHQRRKRDLPDPQAVDPHRAHPPANGRFAARRTQDGRRDGQRKTGNGTVGNVIEKSGKTGEMTGSAARGRGATRECTVFDGENARRFTRPAHDARQIVASRKQTGTDVLLPNSRHYPSMIECRVAAA
ncbi:cytochrome C, partial [Burkholderia multivorans]